MNPKRVTVFGGASPRPGESAYLEAETLGRLLGQAGCIVLNGGYIGTMEAVSKGAQQAGGKVIGVTCVEIENWRRVAPNAYVQQEVRCATLAERLTVLVRECDAAIALPGGMGTLAEILFMWNLLVIRAVPPKPLVLVGAGWQAVIEKFLAEMSGYNPAVQQEQVLFAADVAEAVSLALR